MRKALKIIIFLFAVSLLCASTTLANQPNEVEFIQSDIFLTFDVEKNSVDVEVRAEMNMKKGYNYFLLNDGSQFEFFSINDSSAEYTHVSVNNIEAISNELNIDLSLVELDSIISIVLFNSDNRESNFIHTKYKLRLFQDVSNVRFSNENVGREVTGTIFEKGAYLSPSAYYYPTGKEDLAMYKITADIPDIWESISDGNSLGQTEENGRKVQSWGNPFHSDGVMFMAAPYVVKTTEVDGILIAGYFFEEDTSLIDGYLDATVGYMKMYSELIGPYPYERFTIAENFFPTGYGMPAWTLLGQQVIRLPFIKWTSLGHEVLHNWWGNSVYVDYERGNWCESITVYGADYRYKLLKSESEAKDYRKNILKQYVSYVKEGNDFPIREFKSRTSPNTRTIGYNKAMMVYHMIEEEIGTEAFFEAWKIMFDQYRMNRVSWEEWIDTFEKTSGKDLDYILTEWIDQAGAPVIEVSELRTSLTDKKNLREINFTLKELSDQNYTLSVPIQLTGDNSSFDTVVTLSEKSQNYKINGSFDYHTLTIDPDYHLFRKLFPEEIEPIVSATMGYDTFDFVVGAKDFSNTETISNFASNIGGDSTKIHDSMDKLKSKDDALILINPEEIPEDITSKIKISSDSILINGKSYPKSGHSFVLTGRDYHGIKDYILFLSYDMNSLPRIGQLVPHYGKYSYLVFNGPKNVGKGQWEVTESRLKVAIK